MATRQKKSEDPHGRNRLFIGNSNPVALGKMAAIEELLPELADDRTNIPKLRLILKIAEILRQMKGSPSLGRLCTALNAVRRDLRSPWKL